MSLRKVSGMREIMTENQRAKQIELLAPAGSYETFLAVIHAGADAVYLGGSQFGARAYADNFQEEELLEAIDYAHIHDRKVYLTVNTLLKEAELEQLSAYLRPFYRQGLDAVIIQDMGAFALIRREFPDLDIHTSTQMTVVSPYGAAYMKRLGAKRIVTARELSFAEIKAIHETVDIEIESFVHGALCYCYSGQCLFSSMLGGRSGNRGRCAQPCRLGYEVYDESYRKLRQDGTYILSPKDLCTIEHLPELVENGVYSLKIEGRMKQAEYAAGVVSIYRNYLDRYLSIWARCKQEGGQAEEVFRRAGADYRVEKEDMQKLWDFGNRSGFTDGYFFRQNGKDMITFEKPNHAKSNEALQKEVREAYLHKEIKEKIKGILRLKKDVPATIELSYQDIRISETGAIVQPALKQPLSRDKIENSIKKTGNTPFAFSDLQIEMEEDIFLPIQALNQLRRDALLRLEAALIQNYRRNIREADAPGKPHILDVSTYDTTYGAKQQKTDMVNSVTAETDLPQCENLAVSVETKEQLAAALLYDFVDDIYLDSSSYVREQLFEQLFADIKKIHQRGKKAYYILPAVFRDKTAEFYRKNAEQILNLNLDGVMVKSYDAAEFVKKQLGVDIALLLDHNLYTYNREAKGLLMQLHPVRDTAPLEANRKELSGRDNRNTELVIYGNLPLMTSAQCIHANIGTCDRTPKVLYLKDRYGKHFPVKNNCAECYNTIYNSTPLILFDYRRDFEKMGICAYRISFTTEGEKDVKELMKLYQETFGRGKKRLKETFHGEYTNGHYKRGVE